MHGLLLVLVCCQAAPLPPPLASLFGAPVTPDENPRDVPVVTNFWGSVGSAHDVIGLSQVQVPPFVDVGVSTGGITIGSQPPCSPETLNPWTAGTSDTNLFYLVNETPMLRTYNVSCVSPGCTSWHNATATSPYPFTGYHIVYDEIPPHPPFTDDGSFDVSCTVVTYSSTPFQWCASQANPSCTPTTNAVPLEGWQWTPTGTLRWGGPAATETRMLFEGNGVLQRLTLSAPPDQPPLANVSVSLTGAMRVVPQQAWITNVPGSTAGYSANVTLVGSAASPALLACDGATPACAAWVVAEVDDGGAGVTWEFGLAPGGGGVTGLLSLAAIPPGSTVSIALALVFASGAPAALATASDVAGGDNFSRAWEGFAAQWEARWLDAFSPKAPNASSAGHFSGSLPVLQVRRGCVGWRD